MINTLKTPDSGRKTMIDLQKSTTILGKFIRNQKRKKPTTNRIKYLNLNAVVNKHFQNFENHVYFRFSYKKKNIGNMHIFLTKPFKNKKAFGLESFRHFSLPSQGNGDNSSFS